MVAVLLLSQVWGFLADGGGTWFAYALTNPRPGSQLVSDWSSLGLGVLLALTVCVATAPESLRRPSWPAIRSVWPLACVTLAVVGAAVLLTPVYVPSLLHSVPGVLGYVVQAPVVEEMLFRGAIFGLVASIGRPAGDRRAGGSAALVVSALAFGAVHWAYHLYDFTAAAGEQVAYAVLLGLVLGVIRMRTGNIWAGVGLHAGINGLALLLR